MAKGHKGPERQADFSGTIYDANETGSRAKIAEIRLWWKLSKGSTDKPYLSGACRDGNRFLRIALFPKSPGSFPTPSVFKELIDYERSIDDPPKKPDDDIFS